MASRRPAAMEFCIGNDSPESALAPDWNMPELAVDKAKNYSSRLFAPAT
jgi:hypothetical protein